MADLSDASAALVSAISSALYPNGTNQPSVMGYAIAVYGGWPRAAELDANLAAANLRAHVTVWPLDGERNTTRYPLDWQTASIATPTITATANGQAITISGAMPSPFTAHVIGAKVGGVVYAYAVQPTDTLATIAAGLAAAITVPGTSATGPVVTVGPSQPVQAARVAVMGTSIREVRRQERQMRVSVWTNTPQSRDALAAAVDLALATTRFLTLADGSAMRVIYKGSRQIDDLQRTNLYRRDLDYTVEFATTQTETDTQILGVIENFNTQPDGATGTNLSITVNA